MPSAPKPSAPSAETLPPNVRTATPADSEAVYDLLVAAHQDNGVFALAEPRVRAMIDVLTRHPAGGAMGFIGVIDAPDAAPGLAAGVLLMLSQYWFSDEWLLDELINFVRPAYRKSRYAQDLIQFAKATADAIGVPLGMTVMSTKRTQAKVKLYGRQLRQVGGAFMHGIERANGPLALEARGAPAAPAVS